MGVKRPYSFYYPGNNDWVRENPYSSTSRLWDNPTWHSDTDKSFFDPCPPGWRLPVNNTWHSFATTIDGSSARPNAKEYFESANAGFKSGWNFYMGGPATGETSWYPASGYRSVGSGAMFNERNFGYCWSASPYNSTLGYYLYFYSTLVSPLNNNYRSYGFAVRPLQE